MRTRNLLLSALLGATLLSPVAPILAQPINPPRSATPPGMPSQGSFADIVQRVAPAVVSIDVKVRAARPRTRAVPADPFPNPFGDRGQPAPQPEARAEGSGFFISGDGYVVTNNHVVADATEITVKTQDERELTARVIGRDEPTDLAVLKVEGRNFPFVSFANAVRPRVGDWVIAVGNPFGLGGTATAGIVSAYGRDVGSSYVDFIQIDAAINRGNSGGPTFDANGRVIGVNSMIFSPSGGSVGIGFAIPAEVADRIVRDLIANGRIDRGYMGAAIQTLTSDMAESLGLGERKGALIADVTAGGPSERAGLQSGDVVTRINGQPVENASQLTRRVAQARVGEVLRLDVVRDRAPRVVEVRAGLRPSEDELNNRPGSGSDDRAPARGRLGLSLRTLDEQSRSRLGLPGSVRGALVESVEPNSDAQRKGVRAGDVVVRINDRPVASPADLADAVEAAGAAGRRSVLLFVYRDGRQLAVPVELTAARGGAPGGRG